MAFLYFSLKNSNISPDESPATAAENIIVRKSLGILSKRNYDYESESQM